MLLSANSFYFFDMLVIYDKLFDFPYKIVQKLAILKLSIDCFDIFVNPV